MFAELAQMNITALVSMYPYQNVGSSHYTEFVSGNLSAVDVTGAANAYNGCLGGQTLLDAFSPAARNATFQAWSAGYSSLAPQGMRPWMWQDCSEPGRDASLNGRWRFSAGMDEEVGPAWTREYARFISEGYGQQGLNASSYVTLSRASYPGSSALSAALWSGDVGTDFATLQEQVAVAQQASMSGVALWASDTGGYLGGNASDAEWNELLVRWTQFSALTPIFRYHGKRLGGDNDPVCGLTHGDNEFWSFLPFAQAAIAPAMHFREALRPYVLELSKLTAQQGLPMVRPTALAFPADELAAQPSAQASYLFGPALLVQPVTSLGARSATVYLPRLPAGETWAYCFNRSMVWPEGGFNVTVAAPLQEWPLFVREQSPLASLCCRPVARGEA
jgi:alpha-D-xyloside xylohydrolase